MNANAQAARLLLASLPERDCRAILADLAGTPQPAAAPRIIRRAEAARRLAVTPRTLDAWTRSGLLEKVKLAGRKNGLGFRSSDIDALVAGKGGSHDG